MSSRRVQSPPTQVPEVHPGDIVWCRTGHDTWVRRRAVSAPRFDHKNAYRIVWLSVATVGMDEADDASFINWPVEDVRPDSETPPGPVAATC